VPHLGYDDLEIGDGLLASLAYEELRDPNASHNRAAVLRVNLLASCRRDTEARGRARARRQAPPG